MLLLGRVAPDAYIALLEEDRIVEWGTFWLFLVAGAIGLHRAVVNRRVFDGLVALFCLFVAGEEISWGQRLLGFYPPEYFLANNFQQELSVHNLAQWAVQPKWFLIAVLAAYGIVLPALSRQIPIARLAARAGASIPEAALTSWFAAAIVLLWWYPHEFTGEWVELQAGMLFFGATRPGPKWFWGGLSLAVAGGMAVTLLAETLDRGRDVARVACADAEARNLLGDLMDGGAATDALWSYRRVHKRLWTAVEEGLVTETRLRPFAASACEGAAGQRVQLRRQYAIDPWGSAYWLLMERGDSGERTLAVYSFGPNRRRDGPFEAGAFGAADDVAATAARRLSE